MNLLKKSQAKRYLLIGLLILTIALLKHPSLKPFLPYYSSQTRANLIKTLTNNENRSQTLWKFREFYSRGTISLSKYQKLKVPPQISENVKLPKSFNHYMTFESNKIKSVEGSVDNSAKIFLKKDQLPSKNWAIILENNQVQIIENKINKQMIIVGLFDIKTASTANGYLYFDLRNDEFQKLIENKKWLVVSFVEF